MSDQSAERLTARLRHIRDSGYQPMYNGRPSCPFCGNFVDNEETHSPDCVLVATLDAARGSAGPGLTPLALQIALDRIDSIHAGYWDRRQTPPVYVTNAGLALALWEALGLAAARFSAPQEELFVTCGIDGCDFAVERGEGRTMALHQSEDHAR